MPMHNFDLPEKSYESQNKVHYLYDLAANSSLHFACLYKYENFRSFFNQTQ